MSGLVSFLSDLLSIFSSFGDPKAALAKLARLSRAQKVLLSALLVLALSAAAWAWLYFTGRLSPAITQVTLSEYQLAMDTGSEAALSATVLYSDNSRGSDVLWVSSNEAAVQVSADGRLTALAEGSSIITAQASNRNSVERAECLVTVSDPLAGYSISVRRTALDNFVYIYVQPYDDNVTSVQLHTRSPSGLTGSPSLDKNDLYYFYTETGAWTVYASLQSGDRRYEAHKPEDFVTIEISDISADTTDALFAGLPVL